MKLKESFHDTLGLLKSTFTIIRQNKAILKPTLVQAYIAAGLGFVLLASLIGLIVGAWELSLPFLVFSMLVFICIFPFIKTFFRAAQVWLVYTTYSGEPVPYREGISRARANIRDILTLGALDIVLTAFSRHLKNGQKGIFGAIRNLLGKLLEDGWDLANHFLLPASIIREKRAMEVAKELKYIRNNIPAALAGVFGLDFAGDFVVGIFNSLLFVIVFVSALVSALISSWWPVLIALSLAVLLNAAFRILIDMIKTIYFTLFYMAVALPMHISEHSRAQVTRFLLHQQVEPEDLSTHKKEDYVRQLLPYIAQYKAQGYSEDEIVSFLLQYGWQEELVRQALARQ
jgi:hypothetical protein